MSTGFDVQHTVTELCKSIEEIAFEGALGRAGLQARHLVRAIQRKDHESSKKLSTSLSHVSWEALHSGPWHAVPVAWREIHSLAAIAAAIQTLRDTEASLDMPSVNVAGRHQQCLRSLDVALLIGGPRLARLIHPLVDHIHARPRQTEVENPQERKASSGPEHLAVPTAETDASSGQSSQWFNAALQPHESEEWRKECTGKFGDRCSWLEAVQAPGLMQFEEEFMMKQRPVLLCGVADAWPAMHRWSTPGYLEAALGHRTLPVEVGSHYLASGWSEKLMTFSEFLSAASAAEQSAQRTACAPGPASPDADTTTAASAGATSAAATGAGAAVCALPWAAAADAAAPGASGALGDSSRALQEASAPHAGHGATPGAPAGAPAAAGEAGAQHGRHAAAVAERGGAQHAQHTDQTPAADEPRKRRRIFTGDLLRPAVDGGSPRGDTAAEDACGDVHPSHAARSTQRSSCVVPAEARGEKCAGGNVRLSNGAPAGDPGPPAGGGTAVMHGDGAKPGGGGKVYMAQHPLFEQVPALRRDIMVCVLLPAQVPEYCALGEGDIKSINAWIGPAGTVTPLHTDPHHNLFVQVSGCKYFQIYPPEATPFMYPHTHGLTTNSSRVDARNPDAATFPLFARARGYQCIISRGQALYLPPGWWHYVEALTPSISVSFWWA